MKKPILIFFGLLFTSISLFSQCVSGDCLDGKGIYTFPSGAKYVGEFQNGEVHGQGICYYTDNSKYDGQWANRRPEGYGIFTMANGTSRSGFWQKGLPVNETSLQIDEVFVKKGGVFFDGTDIQSGCIIGNCQDGRGTFAYVDGSKYEGTFVNGKLDGHGKWHYPNGDVYIGMFKNNFVHGVGTLYEKKGTVLSGNWEQGEYIGERFSSKGQEGCVTGDCFNGRGTYIYKDGFAKYVGNFINGRPHGDGICYFSNGERYTGEWAVGSFNGIGTLFMQDGGEVTGIWRNGAFEAYMPTENKQQYTYQSSTSPEEEQNTSPQEEIIETTEESYSAENEDNPTSSTDLKVWAIIVGVASYEHMPVLRYTDDDAYRMYAFLKSPEGGALADEQIRILIDENATKENILSIMNETFMQAGANDLVLLYFSGHGLKGSFLPIDFDGFNNKIFHEEITDIFQRSPAKYKLCIADACHSGSLLANRGANVQNTLLSYYENLAKAQAGTALLMSSKSEENSLESSGLRQGVFSHFLIRGLKGEADQNGNNIVTIQELFNYIELNVREYTVRSQSPVIRGDYDKNMTVAVKRD